MYDYLFMLIYYECYLYYLFKPFLLNVYFLLCLLMYVYYYLLLIYEN